MQTLTKRLLFVLIAVLSLSFVSILPAKASDTPSENGYKAIIKDDADLFSQDEERALLEIMEKSLQYGNMFLFTTNSNPYSASYDYNKASYLYNDETYLSIFGVQQGVAFIIDMDNRNLSLSGEEDLDSILTNSYCDIITDNVYMYAGNEDYYSCAYKCFEQVNSLLKGKYIPKPMKHISNILLSILLALVLNFLFAMSQSKKSKASKSELAKGIISKCDVTDTNVIFLNQTRVRRSSESSGGGSHHSSGGGSHHSSGGSHSSSSHHSSSGGHRF